MENILSGSLRDARQQIDGLVDQAIDRFAGLVPGGEQYSTQAKQTISGALDTLQQQLEQQVVNQAGNLSQKAPGDLGETLGNIFGGGKAER